MQRLLVVGAAIVLGSACGSRCKDVAAARTALTGRLATSGRAADVELVIPLARANVLIDELLQAQPLTVPLDPPELGPVELAVQALTATAREVRVLPGAPGKLRFAVRVEVRDVDHEVSTLAAVVEVTPVLTRDDEGAELAIGFGPENLVDVKPELGPDASRRLDRAVTRWVPTKVRDRLPAPLLDAAAHRLGGYLTGAAWHALRRTLLARVGELTRLRLRLPEVPVARVELHSTPRPEQLVVELFSDLPIRAGLATPRPTTTDEISVRIAGSAAAELANWAIDHGHAPRWYDRSLGPTPTGEFRPRFDYLPGRSHPLEVYAFQDRGGCSYFRVGVRGTVTIDGDQLVATARDREIVAMVANPVVELAAWVKYFFTGAIDRSKRVAAHTRLTIGGRPLETRVVDATLAHDELTFALRFTAAADAPTASR